VYKTGIYTVKFNWNGIAFYGKLGWVNILKTLMNVLIERVNPGQY
jgi:hypothetical protein